MDDGFYAPQPLNEAAFAALPFDGRATCTADLQSADAVPCVSAVVEAGCLSGSRRCGDEEDNGREPQLMLALDATPRTRRRVPTTLRIELPASDELAGLFFASLDTQVGGTGYTVELLSVDGSSIAIAPSTVTSLPTDRLLELPLQAASDDAYLRELAALKYVRIVLPGRLRQLWLRRVELVEVPAALEHMPPPPRAPPAPVAPPPASCTLRVGELVTDAQIVAAFDEPCGLTLAACCGIAAASHGDEARLLGYSLAATTDDFGCCRALLLTGTTTTPYSGPTYAGSAWGTAIVAL